MHVINNGAVLQKDFPTCVCETAFLQARGLFQELESYCQSSGRLCGRKLGLSFALAGCVKLTIMGVILRLMHCSLFLISVYISFIQTEGESEYRCAYWKYSDP